MYNKTLTKQERNSIKTARRENHSLACRESSKNLTATKYYQRVPKTVWDDDDED